MVDLGPIHEQVKFNHADAQHFAKTCEVAAQSIDGQTGSRSSWEQTALEDFRGYFSEIFRSNAAVRARDASNLSASLNAVARAVRRVSEEARKEQQRRDTARQWASQHDDWWEKSAGLVHRTRRHPSGKSRGHPCRHRHPCPRLWLSGNPRPRLCERITFWIYLRTSFEPAHLRIQQYQRRRVSAATARFGIKRLFDIPRFLPVGWG